MKNMRRILFCVALVATSIILTSCSKEGFDKKIIGSWTLTVATQSYSDIEVLSGGDNWTFFSETSDNYGDFRIGSNGSTFGGRWTVVMNRLTLSYSWEDNNVGRYEYNKTTDYNILSLDDEKMSLCAEDGVIYDFVKVK